MGNSAWAHNPEHRLGVPYANREVAGRYAAGGAAGGSAALWRASFNRGEASRLSNASEVQGFEQRGYTSNHSVFGGYHDGGMTRMQSDRGFSSMGAGRIGGLRRWRMSAAADGMHGGGGGRR